MPSIFITRAEINTLKMGIELFRELTKTLEDILIDSSVINVADVYRDHLREEQEHLFNQLGLALECAPENIQDLEQKIRSRYKLADGFQLHTNNQLIPLKEPLWLQYYLHRIGVTNQVPNSADLTESKKQILNMNNKTAMIYLSHSQLATDNRTQHAIFGREAWDFFRKTFNKTENCNYQQKVLSAYDHLSFTLGSIHNLDLFLDKNNEKWKGEEDPQKLLEITSESDQYTSFASYLSSVSSLIDPAMLSGISAGLKTEKWSNLEFKNQVDTLNKKTSSYKEFILVLAKMVELRTRKDIDLKLTVQQTKEIMQELGTIVVPKEILRTSMVIPGAFGSCAYVHIETEKEGRPELKKSQSKYLNKLGVWNQSPQLPLKEPQAEKIEKTAEFGK